MNILHADKGNKQHTDERTDWRDGRWCEMCQGNFKPNPALAEAWRILHGKVTELEAELPGITFGYLGNFEIWGDDRAFYVFLPHPGRVGSYSDMVSLGEYYQLPAAVPQWDQIAATARRMYHNGSRRVRPSLSADELAAVQAWATHHGRTWKDKLRTAWYTGNYNWSGNYGLLQSIRNNPAFGPEWLNDFKLPPADSAV